MTIFTPEERRALMALVGLLLLGQGFSLWEQHRKSRPDRELSRWLEQVAQARGDSVPAGGPAGAWKGDSTGQDPGPSGRDEESSGETARTLSPERGDSTRIEPSSAIPPGIVESGRLRINEAGAKDLEDLPGIGPALARRILEERTRSGPFRRPQDLLRVKGIGPKKLAKLTDCVDWGPGERNPPAP